jgi:hypothetical protein
VVLGTTGKTSQLSLAASVLSAAKQLKRANEAHDADEMQVALAAVRPVIELLAEQGAQAIGDGPGQVPKQEAWRLKKLYEDMKAVLAKDSNLKFKAKLRTSERVRDRVRRLWDLTVSETKIMADEAGTWGLHQEGAREVVREAYRELHMRVALTVTNGRRKKGEDEEQMRNRLLAQADKDWAEDIAKFEGTSHTTIWLDEIRTKFRSAAEKHVASAGFASLFARVDQDGSGEIDESEFAEAVRPPLPLIYLSWMRPAYLWGV